MQSAKPGRRAGAEILNVVFDLGAVVFEWEPRRLLAKELPLHAATPEAAQRLFDLFFLGYAGEWGDFDRGTIEEPALARGIAARTGLTVDEVLRIVDSVPRALQPMDASVGLIHDLKAAGHRLFYLSNMPAPFAEQLSRRPEFSTWFEDGVFSSTVKLVKPEPAIFRHALRQFGVAASECVFLDDSLPNVAAARAEGWRAVHFVHAAEARKELQAWNLL